MSLNHVIIIARSRISVKYKVGLPFSIPELKILQQLNYNIAGFSLYHGGV